MEKTGLRCINEFYVTSPSGILKAVELVSGLGAWGSVIAMPFPGNAAYAFFLWVALSSWLVVLLTYLLKLFRLTVRPHTKDSLNECYAPELDDIIVNAAIAVLYIPAIIVFAVSFTAIPGYTVAIFVIVISVVTFMVHTLHASTLFVYFELGAEKWPKERKWIWEKMFSVQRGSNGEPGERYRAHGQKDIAQPQPVAPGTSEPEQSRYEPSGHEIYQDLS